VIRGTSLKGASFEKLQEIEGKPAYQEAPHEKRKLSFVLNLVIFILEIGSMVWMMSGISADILADSKFVALKYFTVDSNILMGIAALIVAITYGISVLLWRLNKPKKENTQ